MIVHWYATLSHRTIVITLLVCVFMLYFSYTFNACLLSKINRTFRQVECTFYNSIIDDSPENHFSKNCESQGSLQQGAVTLNEPNANETDSPEIEILGSIVRVVPLNGMLWNETDGLPNSKYRFLQQQGVQLNRHLPEVLIIGVKKSGTRALLEFIRLHPDVRAAGCEVHFFDRHYGRGFHWYRNHMPPTLEGQITMEKTPSYFIYREVPQRVHHMNPGTKYELISGGARIRIQVCKLLIGSFPCRLLVVVRDPVTRAISDYTQAASKKKGMKKFEELVFSNGTAGIVDTSWGPIQIGIYAKYLERWLQYFSLNQFLFISGERLIVDPAYVQLIHDDILCDHCIVYSL